MNYSLLVGIHNMERGNRDELRNRGLTVVEVRVPVTGPAAREKGRWPGGRAGGQGEGPVATGPVGYFGMRSMLNNNLLARVCLAGTSQKHRRMR